MIVDNLNNFNGKIKYIVFRAPGFTPNEYSMGTSTIVGQANAAGAITVGAVLTDSETFNPNSNVASFSSRGGTAVNGNIRNKPDRKGQRGGIATTTA